MESKQLTQTFCIPTKGLGRCLVQRNSMLSCYFYVSCWMFQFVALPGSLPSVLYDPFTVLLSNVTSIYCIQVSCHWKVLGVYASYLSLSSGCFVLVFLGLVLLIRSHILCQKILHAIIYKTTRTQIMQICTNNASNEYSALAEISYASWDF